MWEIPRSLRWNTHLERNKRRGVGDDLVDDSWAKTVSARRKRTWKADVQQKHPVMVSRWYLRRVGGGGPIHEEKVLGDKIHVVSDVAKP